MGSKRTRKIITAILAAALLVAAGAAALRHAARLLKTHVEAALGPDSEVESIAIEHYAIVVRGLRMKAPGGWPVSDAFRAERIVIRPALRALLSGEIRIARIRAENAYLCIFRSADGHVHLLPSLLEKRAAEAPPATTGEGPPAATTVAVPVAIRNVALRGGSLDFFDGNVRKKPHRIRIEDLQGDVGPLAFPTLDSDTRLDVRGIIKGPRRDGHLSVKGAIRFSDLDSEITTSLRGVDLISLEPYLLQSSETGVKRGTLDLEIRSKVANRVLSAPGTMTLSELQLSGSTFMGLPRKAVLAALKSRDDRITIRFDLGGRIDDPTFSLRENLAMRAGAAVAETLGISVRGLAATLGGATQKLTDKLGGLLRR